MATMKTLGVDLEQDGATVMLSITCATEDDADGLFAFLSSELDAGRIKFDIASDTGGA